MKKLLSGIISLAIIAAATINCFALPAGVVDHFDWNFPQYSSADNKFKFRNSDEIFVYMDTDTEGGWIIATEGQYGRKEFDADGTATFDIKDPNNIAYWLNNEFIKNGNGKRALPAEIISNIDESHVWTGDNYIGGVALLSVNEIKKYNIGVKDSTNMEEMTADGYYYWLTRTPDGNGNVIGAGVNRLMHSAAPTALYGVRPAIALTADFVKTVQLDVSFMGKNVKKALSRACSDAQLTNLGYTQEEIKEIKLGGNSVSIRTVTTNWKPYIIDTTPAFTISIDNMSNTDFEFAYTWKTDGGAMSANTMLNAIAGKKSTAIVEMNSLDEGTHNISLYEKIGNDEKFLGDYTVSVIKSNPNIESSLKGYCMEIREKPKERIELIKAAGVSHIRNSVHWYEVETEKGKYNWIKTDAYLKPTLDVGIDQIVILNYYNPLYKAEDTTNGVYTQLSSDSSRQAFANFAKAIAIRYPSVKRFEIWNEPNGSIAWGSAPNSDIYSKLTKCVVDTVKGYNPDIEIFTAGMHNGEPDSTIIDGKTFARNALSAAPMLDGVGFHLYHHWSTPEHTYEFDAFDDVVLDNGGFYDLYRTETGYFTGTDLAGVSLEKQAENNVKLLCWGDYYDVRSTTLYGFVDVTHDTESPENHFGSVYSDLTPKPAYYSVKNYLKEANGAEFIGKFEPATGINAYVYLSKDNKPFAVMWNPEFASAVSYAIPLDIEIYDLYGKRISNAGAVSFAKADAYGGTPVYLKNIPMSYIKSAAAANAAHVLDELYTLTGDADFVSINISVNAANSAADVLSVMQMLNSEAEGIISLNKTIIEKGKLLELIYRTGKWMTRMLPAFEDDIINNAASVYEKLSAKVWQGAENNYVARRIFRRVENILEENVLSGAETKRDKLTKGRILLASYLQGWSESM